MTCSGENVLQEHSKWPGKVNQKSTLGFSQELLTGESLTFLSTLIRNGFCGKKIILEAVFFKLKPSVGIPGNRNTLWKGCTAFQKAKGLTS